jgi:hypothetical protein
MSSYIPIITESLRKKQPGMSFSKWLHIIWDDIEWPLVVVLSLCSWGLGTLGFSQYYSLVEVPQSWLDCIYQSLLLFPMNWNALDPSVPIPIPLQIARFASPFLATYTFFQALKEIFREQTQLLRLSVANNHVIICGLGQKGLLLAKEMRKANRKVVVIELDGNNPYLEACRDMGVILVIGDARDRYILYKAGANRAKKIISVCGDDGTNVEVAEQTRMIVQGRTGKELDCLIHIQDSYLWTLLRERQFSAENSGSFRLDLFNVYDSGARILMRKIFRENNGQVESTPHLLVIGMGGLGEHLIIRAAQEWGTRFAQTDQPLPITVIDPQAEEKLDSLKMRFPLVGDVCALTPLNFSTGEPKFQGVEKILNDSEKSTPVSYVFICLDDASIGFQAGLTLLRFMKDKKIPVMVRMTEDTGLATFLRAVKSTGSAFSNLNAFGLLDQTCKEGLFDDGTHEAMARVIHEHYVESEIKKGHTSAENPSLVDWEYLSDEFCKSNRRQADHIGVKLNAVGVDITPWRNYHAKEFRFSEDEIEIMAAMEHQRWSEERKAQGWRYGPARDNFRKIHPDLLSWKDPQLSEETRQKNREEVSLIPILLARAGFQIYRIGGE